MTKQYHTVDTPNTQIHDKTKYTTLLEQFQNPIEKSQKETQSILLTHKYMTCSLSWLGTDTSINKKVLGRLDLWSDVVMQVTNLKFVKRDHCWSWKDGHDRMVVGFTTTCEIRAYYHKCCEFKSRSWRGVLSIYNIMW